MESNLPSPDQITKTLTDFLTLKFTFQGEALIKQIEEFPLDPILVDPAALLSVIEENNAKNIPKKLNTEGVSIWLPVDEKGNPIVSKEWLKGSACFPWEMDPEKIEIWSDMCDKMHIIVQLAQAAYYGSPWASANLGRISLMFEKLDLSHPYLEGAETPAHQEYRFPIQSISKKEDVKAKSFNLSKMKKKEFNDLFFNILLFERIGIKEFEKKSEEKDEENILLNKAPRPEINTPEKIYKILIYGENSRDPILLNLIKKDLIGLNECPDQSSIAGYYQLKNTLKRLEFKIADTLPKDLEPQDGVISAEYQKDPLGESKKLKKALKARSVLFYGKIPTKGSIGCNNCHITKENASSEGDKEFQNFIRLLR